MIRLRIHRFLAATEAEGPGHRACIWVQGCSIRCRGCFNPHTWTTTGGTLFAVDDLAERVITAPGIEGLTLLGGEPFDQPAACAALAYAIRREGLSVMTFTGHYLDALRAARRPAFDELLAQTDLLVDGPYEQDKPDRVRPWVGSTNQRFHFLSDRYAAIRDRLVTIPDRLEIRVNADGRVEVNGLADRAALRALREAVRGPAA